MENNTAYAQTSNANREAAEYRLPTIGNCAGGKHQHEHEFLHPAHHMRGNLVLCDRCTLEYDRAQIAELISLGTMAGSPS